MVVDKDNELNEELEGNVEELEELADKVEIDNNFNGYFHERDRLAENNIVDEVKTSGYYGFWIMESLFYRY